MITPQALIQSGNHIIDLRAVRFADLSLPAEDESDSWPALFLVFDGYSTTIHGEEAIALWAVLCQVATPLAVTPNPVAA